MIKPGPELIEHLRKRFEGTPIYEHLSFDILELDLDLARLALDFQPRFDNGSGTMHGGILAMLADVGVACALSTNFGGKMGFATSSMNIHFLKRAKTRIIATARIIKKGAKVCVGTVEMEDEKGHLVAKATCDFVLTTSKLPGRSES